MSGLPYVISLSFITRNMILVQNPISIALLLPKSLWPFAFYPILFSHYSTFLTAKALRQWSYIMPNLGLLKLSKYFRSHNLFCIMAARAVKLKVVIQTANIAVLLIPKMFYWCITEECRSSSCNDFIYCHNLGHTTWYVAKMPHDIIWADTKYKEYPNAHKGWAKVLA